MMNSKQVFFGLLVCIAALTSCDTRKQVAVGNELSLTRANIGFPIPELLCSRHMPASRKLSFECR